jgi:hypothetical protein
MNIYLKPAHARHMSAHSACHSKILYCCDGIQHLVLTFEALVICSAGSVLVPVPSGTDVERHPSQAAIGALQQLKSETLIVVGYCF